METYEIYCVTGTYRWYLKLYWSVYSLSNRVLYLQSSDLCFLHYRERHAQLCGAEPWELVWIRGVVVGSFFNMCISSEGP